jgi:hypothetical protein
MQNIFDSHSLIEQNKDLLGFWDKYVKNDHPASG